MPIDDRFRGRLGRPWHALQQNGGQVVVGEQGLQLITPPSSRTTYTNAQIDDYTSLPRRMFPWRPPVRLQVRARFPSPINGTAGFGFWNSPISPLGSTLNLPAAIWFFYASAPSNMAPALGVPGAGWKAATLDLTQPRALRWALPAPAIMLLNRIPAVRAHMWPRIQRDLHVAEAMLGPPSPEWRDYTIEWRVDGARFAIDSQTVLETPYAPRGPLGFVAWIDTQWLIATPDGKLGWGLIDTTAPQMIELAHVAITEG